MSSITRYDVGTGNSCHSVNSRCPVNKVDKDLQSIFLPLNLLQILVLNPKFYIRKNLVKPNDCLQKLILMCGLVIFLSGYVYRVTEIILDDNLKRYGSINFLYYASYFDFVFYSSGFIMNVIIHCKQSSKMVTFVLIFQKIHVFLNTGSIKRSVIRNWTNVTVIFVFYILVMLFSSLSIYNQASWNFALNLLYLASLDSNIIYAISLMRLLVDKLELWSVRVLMTSTDGNDVTYRYQMFEAYKQILKCYDLCKDVFQQQVSQVVNLNAYSETYIDSVES
ncbi:hypothetical protein B5X24_HaOG201000 [Helicoverpa armigera]|nr:hypothetical protein B5X24_HaOG201000 [Helicoverpa armigera]